MAILIDGYNLLHVSGVFGDRGGPRGFERSRQALLNVLAESLTPAEAATTTVVFDAAEAPPGLPRTVEHGGMTVRYASDHADADTLIEALIEEDSAPRRLVVVSADHRLHRAARRRRATAIDSDVWFAELQARRRDRGRSGGKEDPATKPTTPSKAEVRYWLDKFGGAAKGEGTGHGPFPPGYAEDVLEEEEE